MIFILRLKKFLDIKKSLKATSEAATETIFENICSFLPGAPFSVFSRRLYVFTEQMPIFQEPSLCVHRTDTDFPGAPFYLPNRYQFSRSTSFLATEQIPIFQEHFFSYRIDNNFPGIAFFGYQRTDWQFQH